MWKQKKKEKEKKKYYLYKELKLFYLAICVRLG
jgi:hypothetical protein